MADSTMINTVTRLLGMAPGEAPAALGEIVWLVESQLKNRLGGLEAVPADLEYIVINVVAARYNQLGDEGKSSMTVEGESASWMTDLFAPFEKDIQKWLDRQNETVSGGSITFL